MRCCVVGLMMTVLLFGTAFKVLADQLLTDEAPLIEWYMIDLPPIQNATGDRRGQGYTDLMRWRLIAELNDYRHVLRNSNVHRMLSDIKIKPNVCNTAFLKTPEREQFMVYATPLHAQFPNGVVVLKARLAIEFDQYVQQGVLDVFALIEAGGRLAVQSGRSYGRTLDKAVVEAEKRDQLVVITANRPVESKIGLLAANRVDVALLYPYEFTYFLADTELASDYEFLPATGETGYTLNHLACSLSDFGAQVVAVADPLILQERDAYFAAAYRRWLPQSMLVRHAEHHGDAFGVGVEDAVGMLSVQDKLIADCMLDGGIWFRGSCQ